MFLYGWNMPGYAPDCEPIVCDDWSDAVRGLRESIERHYDEDCGDAESGEYADHYATALKGLDTAESESDIHVRYGRYIYWVVAE